MDLLLLDQLPQLPTFKATLNPFSVSPAFLSLAVLLRPLPFTKTPNLD